MTTGPEKKVAPVGTEEETRSNRRSSEGDVPRVDGPLSPSSTPERGDRRSEGSCSPGKSLLTNEYKKEQLLKTPGRISLPSLARSGTTLCRRRLRVSDRGETDKGRRGALDKYLTPYLLPGPPRNPHQSPPVLRVQGYLSLSLLVYTYLRSETVYVASTSGSIKGFRLLVFRLNPKTGRRYVRELLFVFSLQIIVQMKARRSWESDPR